MTKAVTTCRCMFPIRGTRISRPQQLKGVDPGGMIMIHGQRNYFGWLAFMTQMFDWTDGCIAVTNAEMDEIWDMVPNNTPIEINP